MTTRNSRPNVLTPSSLEIVEEIKIGKVECSETKAISVSLIRTAVGYCYVAIYRMNRNNVQSDWTQTSKIWIPFDEADKVSDLITRAYALGLRRGWLNDVTFPEYIKNYNYRKPTEITPLMMNDLEEAIKQEAMTMTCLTEMDVASFEFADDDDPRLLAWNFARKKAEDYICSLLCRKIKE